jgi:hypothetical protein
MPLYSLRKPRSLSARLQDNTPAVGVPSVLYYSWKLISLNICQFVLNSLLGKSLSIYSCLIWQTDAPLRLREPCSPILGQPSLPPLASSLDSLAALPYSSFMASIGLLLFTRSVSLPCMRPGASHTLAEERSRWCVRSNFILANF